MIEFISAGKRYDDGVAAVENFTLQVPPFQTTVLLGSSGSGKTTVLRMVNRMIEASAGQVRIDGEDVMAKPAVALRRSIGYVPQNSGLLPHRTVIDNVATVPILAGTRRAKARIEAQRFMDIVGLDRRLGSRYPAQLSGGQQQRVAVARALADNPNILLMDEPFGAVDPIVRADLQREVLRLQRELRKTVLFVTHDVDEAFLLGDNVVILREGGRIVQQGSPEQILSDPADDFVSAFIGADRGKRRLTISSMPRKADDVLVVDAGGYPVGVISAPEGVLATGDPTPRRRSIGEER